MVVALLVKSKSLRELCASFSQLCRRSPCNPRIVAGPYRDEPFDLDGPLLYPWVNGRQTETIGSDSLSWYSVPSWPLGSRSTSVGSEVRVIHDVHCSQSVASSLAVTS